MAIRHSAQHGAPHRAKTIRTQKRAGLGSNGHSTAGGAGASDAYCTSGSSPTLHVLGVGAVGRSLLNAAQQAGLRSVAVSDSRGTAYCADGLEIPAIHACKEASGSVSELLSGSPLETRLALGLVESELVADCRATSGGASARAGVEDVLAALDSGASVASAAKDACLLAPLELLSGERWKRFGFNAVLGGTGASFKRELEDLREQTRAVRCVPNATTTAVIEAIEAGHDFASAHRIAVEAGVCEADATLDFRGVDAALKLVIVASFLSGTQRSLDEVELPPNLRELDPEELRSRARRGQTTRLVASLEEGGALSVRYEAVARASTFAVPSSCVVYAYALGGGEARVHHGKGLGPERTAQAVLIDLVKLDAERAEVSR